jgi:lysophospholipase L1-like esterase
VHSWQATSSATRAAGFDVLLAGSAFIAIGDSTTDEASNTWPLKLEEHLRALDNPNQWKRYVNGANSRTLTDLAVQIDGILTQIPATTIYFDPVAFLVNIGVNDINGGLQPQAQFEAEYADVIETINAAYPDAQIYLARPWYRDFETESDTIAGWIANVQAAHPAYTVLGPDARVWAKGADNGATMTTDGVHYTAAGQTENAAQWRTVLGF